MTHAHAGSGNLSPLFYSFGLIDLQRLQQDEALHGSSGSSSDRDFFSWLHQTVAEAVRTAEQHETLKLSIRKLRLNLEETFLLSAVQVPS